jgi:hypothetical protein
MLKKISALLIFLFAFNSHAYLVSALNTDKLDPNAPTHILVAGAGDDLGTQFQQVARAKALKYIELYPNEQIVLISHDEPDGDNIALLKGWGFQLIKKDHSTFNGKSFIEEAMKFNQIATIDIFSHSSAQYGIHLDGKAHRLTINTSGVEKLKGHFTKDAYAFIHGCNSGFNLAPFLSNLWEIPVAGSMTSTNFQKLHSDGNFYLTEQGFFPNAEWATTNEKTFAQPVPCTKDGTCIRLKPDNNPYIGFWGEYHDGGLPFYKFFCIKTEITQCKKIMARSMMAFNATTNISFKSSLAEFKKVLFDFLCPVNSTKDLRGECAAALESSLTSKDETYNPFSQEQIECDFISCKAEIKCDKVPLTGVNKPGTCVLSNDFGHNATTLVREYKAYLQGFAELNK